MATTHRLLQPLTTVEVAYSISHAASPGPRTTRVDRMSHVPSCSKSNYIMLHLLPFFPLSAAEELTWSSWIFCFFSFFLFLSTFASGAEAQPSGLAGSACGGEIMF